MRSSASISLEKRASHEFERECISFFEQAVQIVGVPRSVGQIYGALYASPRSLYFSDIVDKLGISKGSVSQGLQLLRTLGAIKVADSRNSQRESTGSNCSGRQSDNLSRREYFEPELSLRRLISGVLRDRISPLAMSKNDRIGRLREIAKNDGELMEFYLERAEQLETWRRQLRTILPVLGMLLGPKSR